MPAPIVAIVSDSASEKYGGEALQSIQYFRRLRARGITTFLVCHERSKAELTETFASAIDFIRFVPDSSLHVALFKISKLLPKRLLVQHLIAWDVQRKAARIIRELTRTHGVTLAQQPSPISPKFPSNLRNAGVPVIIGPMNGSMNYPPGFGSQESAFGRVLITVAKRVSAALNWLIPGKSQAAALVVSNQRTRDALPIKHQHIYELFDGAIDGANFGSTDRSNRTGPATFLFVGRLVDWKGADLLLKAWKITQDAGLAGQLRIVGDGDERQNLERLTDELGLRGSVTFPGFATPQQVATEMRDADVFVSPSFWEAGGSVVLEAMASGLPSVILNWGGPAECVHPSCAVVIEPKSRQFVIHEMASAMRQLAADPARRHQLGEAARQYVQRFDWERKIDAVLEIYDSVLRQSR